VVGSLQRVLAGKDKAQPLPPLLESGDDGCHFDCFRASADDDVDTLTGQSSPWLGARIMAAMFVASKLALQEVAV